MSWHLAGQTDCAYSNEAKAFHDYVCHFYHKHYSIKTITLDQFQGRSQGGGAGGAMLTPRIPLAPSPSLEIC